MLSFNPSNRPIACILGGKYDKKVVYLHRDTDLKKSLPIDKSIYLTPDCYKLGNSHLNEQEIELLNKHIKLGKVPQGNNRLIEAYLKCRDIIDKKNFTDFKLEDGQFLMIPKNVENQRESLLVTGPSGAGKTVFASNYIYNYHDLYPDNPVYIFSKKKEDDAFDRFDFITRIELDDTFIRDVGDEWDSNDFSNSLCVFDDIENVKDQEVKKQVYKLKDDILETGRQPGVYVILCNHQCMNYKETRTDLNESDAIVIFEKNSPYHMNRLLTKYAGLDPKLVKRILDMKGRWAVICKSDPPRYVLSENEIFIYK